MRLAWVGIAALCVGCGGSRTLVPLLSSAGAPLTRTPSPDVPLEVITRTTVVRDPLPVSGSSVSYADFELALGLAVSSAAAPWAKEHLQLRPGGWQLLVEATSAEAEHDGTRLSTTVVARATLRSRDGATHIGQTELACRDAGIVTPEKGATVLYGCMQRLGRDLATWLAAVEPAKPAQAPEPDIPNLAGPIGSTGSVDTSTEAAETEE